MKRAMAILFWAHLLAVPCSMWAQEETEVPWYLREAVPKETGNDNPRATHESRCAFERPFESDRPARQLGLGIKRWRRL